MGLLWSGRLPHLVERIDQVGQYIHRCQFANQEGPRTGRPADQR
jgi:hypothetical protein